MTAEAILSLASVMAGIVLISLGASMSLYQWETAQNGVIRARREFLGPNLTGLSKLAEAVNQDPDSQRCIFFGIILLMIAGLLGGLGAIGSCG